MELETIDCMYRTDENGNLMSEKVSHQVVRAIYDIKSYARQIEKRSDTLNNLIRELELHLLRVPSSAWLEENRERLLIDICLIPDLDILLEDCEEIRVKKMLLGAKLIELINIS